MAKSKKTEELEQQLSELMQDLQRTRADFENYRKRVEAEKKQAMEIGETKTILNLLPVIDTIERAVTHIPDDIKDNQWVSGVAALVKQLDKNLADLDIAKIDSKPGTKFDPELHQAVQFDEDAEGSEEVIESELQAGYTLRGTPIRHAMVRVTKQ